MIPINRGKEECIFDNDTFNKNPGETSKTMGSHQGAKYTSLIKIYLTKTIGKTKGIGPFLQPWDLLFHRLPCQRIS